MNFASTLAAFAFIFVSALEALNIASPAAGAVYYQGQPVPLLINNDIGEIFPIAQVTFASPFGSFIQTLPVGVEQAVYLPCDVNGPVTVAAVNGVTQAQSVQIKVYPNPYPAYGNACNPCASPCANPCPTPCANPRASHHRRSSRRGCRLYSEDANEVTEFVAAEGQSQE